MTGCGQGLKVKGQPKVKGQIMYFLVNASPPKPLDAATPNFVPG